MAVPLPVLPSLRRNPGGIPLDSIMCCLLPFANVKGYMDREDEASQRSDQDTTGSSIRNGEEEEEEDDDDEKASLCLEETREHNNAVTQVIGYPK